MTDDLVRTTIDDSRCPACGKALASPGASCPCGGVGETFSGPRRVAHYRVLRELGAGGMGTVFEVHDERLDRRVAMKVLSRHLGAATKAGRRFEKEAWVAGRLDHPNVVKVHDRGTWEELSYYTMELVDGGSLHDVIENMRRWRRDARLALEFGSREYVHWAVGQIAAAARALDHAHRLGVVHRDVKPMNLLLDGKHGTLKIADFGLALDADATRMTTEGRAVGTLAYMPPEQVLGKHDAIGPATDVYALGATLFELLTLSLPFAGDSHAMYVNAVLTSEARRPSKLNQRVGRDLETVIVKCLEKDPRDRYRSAAELADDLDNVLHLRPIAARPPSRLDRTLKWVRRRPLHAALIALIAIGLPVTLLLLREAEQGRQVRRAARVEALSTELRWLSQRGLDREAAGKADEVLALDARNVAALRSRAVARLRLAAATADDAGATELRRLAIADADALVERLPGTRWPLLLRAFFLEEAGRGAEADETRRRADLLPAGSPGPDDLYFDALLAMDRGDLERAEALLGEAAALRPNDAQPISLRGEVRKKLGKPGAAIDDLRVALAIRPDDYFASYQLGVALTETGEFDEGARYLERAIGLDPARADGHNALAHLRLEAGRAALENGDRAEALRQFEAAETAATEALRLGPNAWTHVDLGASLMERYRLAPSPDVPLAERAIDHYRQAAEMPNADPRAASMAGGNLCDAWIQLGRGPEAIAACEEVTRLHPDEALGFYNLAGAYALAGRRDDALRALERDVELGDRDWGYLLEDPWFASLRDDPRFGELVARMRSGS